ncbi:MAG: hypothetical protein NC908_03035 [Candidatus Omnitrophica bacterium]|nr:hypothetical protein [Candidatus Omnitrophota bacterium]
MKKNNKRFYWSGIVLVFLLLLIDFAFCATQSAEYLCELGINFYKAGRYDDALQEFKKVLIVEPDNSTAKTYINYIFQSDIQLSVIKKEVAASASESVPIATVSVSTSYPEAPKEKTIIDTTTHPIVSSSSMQSFSDREAAMENALSQLMVVPYKQELEKISTTSQEIKGSSKIKITGEAQIGLGITPEDLLWKQANFDLNEKNWRVLSDTVYNRRTNTYDPRIYDRLRLNLDSQNEEGFNFHTNITVDPWSFTGKSARFNLEGVGTTDEAQAELKYWSNTGYTIPEIIYTLRQGASINLPEIKVVDGRTPQTIVESTWTSPWPSYFIVPEQKINIQFQPLRELWFDYIQPGYFKIRFFPIAYQDQALTSDDPLRLSNNFIWWDNSPWLNRWLPGIFNAGALPVDFTPGQWDNSLSFFTRDSDGTRLTALRGLSFELTPDDKISLYSTFASPKDLWQDYDSFDNLINATRFKYSLLDNFYIGSTCTYRIGFNEDNKKDVYNYVGGIDFGYEPVEGLLLSLETATSLTKQDLSSPDYTSKKQGNAYYFSLIGSSSKQRIISLKYGYNELSPQEHETSFTKYRVYWTHMDRDFEASLSNFTGTRSDTFWSRHIHFRRPFQYFYGGLYAPTLKWEDIDFVNDRISINRTIKYGIEQTPKTKGSLATMRSSLNIYYGDVEGFYPLAGTGDITSDFTSVMVPKYLKKIPEIRIPTGHPAGSLTGVEGYASIPTAAANVSADGSRAWGYCGNSTSADYGNIIVNCSHTDTKGEYWYNY